MKEQWQHFLSELLLILLAFSIRGPILVFSNASSSLRREMESQLYLNIDALQLLFIRSSWRELGEMLSPIELLREHALGVV